MNRLRFACFLALSFSLLTASNYQQAHVRQGSGNPPWGSIQGLLEAAQGSPTVGIGFGAGDYTSK